MPKMPEGKLKRGERMDALLFSCGLRVRAHPKSFYLSKRELTCLESYIAMLRKRGTHG